MTTKIITKKPMNLNYSRIKLEITKAGFSIKEFSLELGRSENYFFQAEKLNSMKVNDLCDICMKLNLPVQYFIDNNIEQSGYGQAEIYDEVELLRRILQVNKEMLLALEKLSK